MAGNSGDDASAFGRLVRARREARRWSQEVLANAAFPGSDNKSYISRIENGKVPNVTRDTVRNIARALDIDPEHIPPALRWPEATEVVKDTNTVAHEIKEQLDRLVAAKEGLAREFGIKEGMLIALARRYAEGNPGDFDAALIGLERALEVARTERERDRLPSNLSDAVNAVIARMDALNEGGDLDGAQAALDAELVAFDEEDQRRRTERGRLYEKGIAQAILTRSIENASRFLVAQIELVAPTDREEQHSQFLALFLEWHQRGSDKGLNFDLEVSIALAREGLERSETLDHRGTMRNYLSIALLSLGERESGTARLEQAVEASKQALEELTRERVPLGWAATQMNLGNSLYRLGEREGSTERMELAIDAYTQALEEGTRERVPLEWAVTQMNLGNVLLNLGERESDTTRLERAVEVYKLALKERTRERVPLEWAATQMNLGNALRCLGMRESGTKRLKQAIVAFKKALEEMPRERVPLIWATTQMNLGTALLNVGERQMGTARLKQAVVAYTRALDELTRERVPLDWAATQMNLGTALCRLGQRERSTARLEQSVEAIRQALKERTRERVPLDWAMIQLNLGGALLCLGERESGTARLEQAVEAYKQALEEWTRERVPFEWALTQMNLGNALWKLGERESSTVRLEKAIEAYTQALKEKTRECAPLEWAIMQMKIGLILIALAHKLNDIVRVVGAISCFDGALTVFREASHVLYLDAAQSEMRKAKALHARLIQGVSTKSATSTSDPSNSD